MISVRLTPPFSVIPGWSEGPDLRSAIAHRGISRFSGAQLRTIVRCFASPRNDGGVKFEGRWLRLPPFFVGVVLAIAGALAVSRCCAISPDGLAWGIPVVRMDVGQLPFASLGCRD